MKFGEFMSQKATVDRWFLVKVVVIGAFCGAVLTYVFLMAGLAS